MAIPGGRGILTSWTYEGDLETATQWLPYAQSMLQNYARLGVRCNNSVPVEGVEIRIDTFSGRIHIKAEEQGGIYMECGIAEMHGIGIGSQYAYRPATIHYTPEVDSEYSQLGSLFGYVSQSNKLQTLPKKYKFTISGQRSSNENRNFNGYGHNDNLQSISLGCIEKSRTGTGDNLVCETNPALLYKKQLATRHPSSLYQGKMQLFIQALYGSTRTDFNLVDSGIFKAPLIEIPFEKDNEEEPEVYLTLNPYTTAYGICTTSDMRYYLLAIDTNVMMAYTLNPDSIGKKFQSKLNQDKIKLTEDEKVKIECLILSTCRIGRLIGTISLPIQITGESFFYSWRLNWDCTEGMYIGHYPDNAVKKMRSYPYKIEIKLVSNFYDNINSAINAARGNKCSNYSEATYGNKYSADYFLLSMTEEPGGGYWKVHAHTVWAPDLSTGGSIVFADPWGPISEAGYFDYDTLVYGYYEGIGENSTFIPLYFSSIVTNVYASTSDTSYYNNTPGYGYNNMPNAMGKIVRNFSQNDTDVLLTIKNNSASLCSAEKKALCSENKTYFDLTVDKESGYAVGHWSYYGATGHEQEWHWGKEWGWKVEGAMNDYISPHGGYNSYYYYYPGNDDSVRPYYGDRRWLINGYKNYKNEPSIEKSGQIIIMIPFWDASSYFAVSNTTTESDGYEELRYSVYSFVLGVVEIFSTISGVPDPLDSYPYGPNITGLSFSKHSEALANWEFDEVLEIDIGGGLYYTGASPVYVNKTTYTEYDVNVSYFSPLTGGVIVFSDVYETPPDWLNILANPHDPTILGDTSMFCTSKRSINTNHKAVFVDNAMYTNSNYDYDSAIGWV